MNEYIWLWVAGLIVLFVIGSYFDYKVKGDPSRDVDEGVSEETPCEKDVELREVMQMCGDAKNGIFNCRPCGDTTDYMKMKRVTRSVGGSWKIITKVVGSGYSKVIIEKCFTYNDITYKDGCKVGDHYYFKGEYLTSCEWSLLRMFIDHPQRFSIRASSDCLCGEIVKFVSIRDKETSVTFTQNYNSVYLGDKVTSEGWKVIINEVYLTESTNARKRELEAKKAKEEKMLSLYCKCED